MKVQTSETLAIDENFIIPEEIMKMQLLYCNTKSLDIYAPFDSAVSEYGLFHKCSCIINVNDNTRVMTGSKLGLVGLLTENGLYHTKLHYSTRSVMWQNTEDE